MQFPMSRLNTVLFALAPCPHKTQQFQKNAYHNDKCVISEKSQGCLWSHLTHTLPHICVPTNKLLRNMSRDPRTFPHCSSA
jgi:hypothetical protein